MQAIREIVRAEQIAPFIKLPKDMLNKRLEIIVVPIYDKEIDSVQNEQAVNRTLEFMDSRPRVNVDIKTLIEEGRD
ncbi:MAG: hypothetical protein LBE89_00020 [Helicobacteraceae bacterium]|jgi:hypothetical protein|nr:hypothetical protein [Helicobacteraceae bacterium]